MTREHVPNSATADDPLPDGSTPGGEQTDRAGRSSGFWWGISAAVVALVLLTVAALVGAGGSGDTAPTRQAGPAAPAGGGGTGTRTSGAVGSSAVSHDPLAAVARRTPGDPLAIGRVDAPVVMVEFADFQCPFCGKFARDTEPTLVRKYVRTGKLRLEWRDFPYLGPQSSTAAQAARAAADQGKFWPYHDALYHSQHPVNSGYLTPARLAHLARGLGLTMRPFHHDARSRATAFAVQSDFRQGLKLGITGTPAFLINGKPVSGAQPLATFERLIDQQLKTAG